MTAYPATFDVSRPARFERPQVFVRLLAYLILGVVNYIFIIGLPVYAALTIGTKGADHYIKEDAARVTGWLKWYIGLYAYVMVTTDKLPMTAAEAPIRFEVQAHGTPTIASALLRFITSIPSGIILSALATVGAAIWLVASVMILLSEEYSEGLYDFQRGIVRWTARFIAYHASLVPEYPPFAFDMGTEGATPATTSAA